MATQTSNISKLGDALHWPTEAFWRGQLAGTMIIAGGKVWTLLTNPSMKVSTLMGHIGTPAFRRELAVFCLVTAICNKILMKIGKKFNLDKQKYYQFSARVISLTAGCIAGASVTATNYHPVYFYPMCAVTVMYALIKGYEILRKQGSALKLLG